MKRSMWRTKEFGVALLMVLGILQFPAKGGRLVPVSAEVERALHHNSSQDFFQQGLVQMEREIQWLMEGKVAKSANPLRINEDVRNDIELLQEETEGFENIFPRELAP
ncbi:hypothetical protein [Lusitaniella coriacea]|uniref:hypothetical protein n=1 Tax=Lusitaniella coriacea TaxID=1983105 RepID=UPI003CF8B475